MMVRVTLWPVVAMLQGTLWPAVAIVWMMWYVLFSKAFPSVFASSHLHDTFIFQPVVIPGNAGEGTIVVSGDGVEDMVLFLSPLLLCLLTLAFFQNIATSEDDAEGDPDVDGNGMEHETSGMTDASVHFSLVNVTANLSHA
jgi:hypothetical protein